MNPRTTALWFAAISLTALGGCGDDSSSGSDADDVSSEADGVEETVEATDGTDGRPDGCVNFCTLGAAICSGAGYRECETQASGCTDFAAVVACGTGEVCSGGVCGATCRDVCADGDRLCSGAGYVECAAQTSGCLDWNEPVACPLGESCSDGGCASG